MSEFGRSFDQANDQGEERLPWLEPVDEFEEEGGIPIVKLIGAVVIGLVALGLIVGGVFWLRNRDSAGGDGALIQPQPGPIKEKPEAPGGMAVEGAGDLFGMFHNTPASASRQFCSSLSNSTLTAITPRVRAPDCTRWAM